MAFEPPFQSDLARSARTAHWRAWIILWACLLVCETVLLCNNAGLDTLTWRATRWFVGDRDKYTWADYHAAHLLDPAASFYQHDPPPFASHFYKHTQRFWEVVKTFGEPWFVLLIVLLIATYDRRRWRSAATAAIAIALAGGTGALIRILDGRYRPINIDGANQWALFRGFTDGSDLETPSPPPHHARPRQFEFSISNCRPPSGLAPWFRRRR